VFYRSDKLPCVTGKNTPSTSALLLRSLDAILHEVQQMEDALRDASKDEIVDADRRRLRCETDELRHRAEFLMKWLADVRLEQPRH
jgi:hypothetical protein